eukprot:TRINITY_DN4101_c3_g1_i1.p1 TRINITY_DN4101_c3_g1~~TRINITY_DN4101_c3_g1_i1.p1  ORF type:complete len:433 (+),score=61.15 TRINITY_DN4101_c3_g1_i1:79-1299(+)
MTTLPPSLSQGAQHHHQQQQQQQQQHVPGVALKPPTGSGIELKVMRLLRPEVKIDTPIYTEEGDIGHGIFGGGLQSDMVPDTELLVPVAMGQIHMGEVFRICISLHNVRDVEIHNVSLKVELLTQKRVDLLNTSLTLAPRAHSSQIVEYSLQDEGSHTLMCYVSYQDYNETKTFRKVFKFPVGHTVHINNVRIWTISDHVMIYVEIKNTSKTPLLVDINFCTSASYKLEEAPNDWGEVWQRTMGHGDIWRYLFRLTPHEGKRDTSLGRLEITWKGRMGERGRLESTDIQQRGVDRQPIELSNLSLPNSVSINKPFFLEASLVNNWHDNHSLPTTVTLNPEKMYPILYTGPSSIDLGTISPGQHVPIKIRLVAVGTGIIELKGIDVVNTETGRSLCSTLSSIHVCAS